MCSVCVSCFILQPSLGPSKFTTQKNQLLSCTDHLLIKTKHSSFRLCRHGSCHHPSSSYYCVYRNTQVSTCTIYVHHHEALFNSRWDLNLFLTFLFIAKAMLAMLAVRSNNLFTTCWLPWLGDPAVDPYLSAPLSACLLSHRRVCSLMHMK